MKTSLGIVFPPFTLGDYPVANTVAWTISLPRNHHIAMSKIQPPPRTFGKRDSLMWKEMTPRMQWNFVKYTYGPALFKYCGIDKMVMYPELNKKGDIHAHCAIWSDDPEYDVMEYRKFCSHHINSLYIHRHKNEHRLNYIHTITDAHCGKLEWIQYIQKQRYKLKSLSPYIV